LGAEDSYRQGVEHAEGFRFEEARRSLEQAVAQGAGADALAVLSAVRGELGDGAGAEDALARAIALRPMDPALALLDATLLPMVYRDVQDLERWRSRYASRLDQFVRDIDRYRPEAAKILGLARTNFLLAYQGRDDRALQARLCEALTALLRVALPQYFAPRPRMPRSRIRVGFASAFLFDCTVGRYFASWIEGLDPARFEVACFMTGTANDALTDRLAQGCAFFERVNLPVADIAARIAAAELDVLIYPEIGMDPRCRLLSCLRLAPTQLAAWGHPQTTGSPEIDGYLTCAEMEGREGPAHYTEPLLALPGLGVAYDPLPTPPPFTRSELGFEDGRPVYCCPHSLFKLHPDSDALFAEILAADPDGLLVLFNAQSAGAEPARVVAQRVARALEQRGVAPRRQLRILPRMAPADFRSALQAADVVVDPLHWSGGNTALDALAMGVPVVTTPGVLMRSRQAAAMLRRLEVPGLVAGTVEESARIAANVANDRTLRDAMSLRIRAGLERLFGDREPVMRLASLLEESATRK
jgi:CRISPR-associated protein Csy1